MKLRCGHLWEAIVQPITYTASFDLCNIISIKKIIELGNRLVVTGGRGDGRCGRKSITHGLFSLWGYYK